MSIPQLFLLLLLHHYILFFFTGLRLLYTVRLGSYFLSIKILMSDSCYCSECFAVVECISSHVVIYLLQICEVIIRFAFARSMKWAEGFLQVKKVCYNNTLLSLPCSNGCSKIQAKWRVMSTSMWFSCFMHLGVWEMPIARVEKSWW